MVPADFHNPFPEQSRLVQRQAEEVSAAKLFSGLLWWRRRQQSCEVLTLAVQPSEQSASELIPTVCPANPPQFTALMLTISSLTQATDTSNIRLVFAAVKETILQNALKDSGIL